MKSVMLMTLRILAVVLLMVVFSCAIFLPAIVTPFTSLSNVANAAEVSFPNNGVVNQNLLKNSDFKINTNGEDSYNQLGYTVDNWFLWNGLGSVTVLSDGLILFANNSDVQNLILSQLFDFSVYAGQYLTLSISTNYGVFSASVLLPSSFTSNASFAFTGIDNTNSTAVGYFRLSYWVNGTSLNNYKGAVYQFDIGCFPGFTFTVDWCKLEVGQSFTGYVPNYQDEIHSLQNKLFLEQIKYGNLQDNFDELEENYNSLQNDMNELQKKLDVIQSNGAMFSNLSVNSVSRLNAKAYSDGTINGELLTYDAKNVDIIRDSGNEGVSNEINAYPDNVTYNVLRWNGTGGGINQFNNGGKGVGVTVPITSFNNDLGYVPANADMTFTLKDTYVVSYGTGYSGQHANILRFVFYDKEGNIVNVTKDNWIVGTSQVLNRRASFNEIFGFDYDSVPMQFGFPNFGQSYTFNLPVDVYFIGIYCTTPLSSTNYSVGYDIALAYQGSNSSDYLYDVGFRDGALSVDTQKYYDEGYRVGNNKGYADGQASQGDYTFFGLISAVVDAPLSVFKDMFDFEVLGMNLSSFLLSLFSVSLILCVVKLLIGR